MKQDVYERITNRIVQELEQGTLPWLKPQNAEHAAGRITRTLRHNGMPYQGINVIMLWREAVAKGYAALIQMTFKQALELGGHGRMNSSCGKLPPRIATLPSFDKEHSAGILVTL